MEVALMSRPTEFKAGLPEDFSGKNDDAMHWLLAMKAYFTMNNEIYKEEKTTVLIFLHKLSKGRGSTFAEGWYLKLANPANPESERPSKNYVEPLKKPSSQRTSRTEHTRPSIPSAWTSSMVTLMNTPPPSNSPKPIVESMMTASS